MNDLEKHLRFYAKWSRGASYILGGLAFINALIGNLFFIFCFVMGVVNYAIAEHCEKRLKDEFPKDI